MLNLLDDIVGISQELDLFLVRYLEDALIITDMKVLQVVKGVSLNRCELEDMNNRTVENEEWWLKKQGQNLYKNVNNKDNNFLGPLPGP